MFRITVSLPWTFKSICPVAHFHGKLREQTRILLWQSNTFDLRISFCQGCEEAMNSTVLWKHKPQPWAFPPSSRVYHQVQDFVLTEHLDVEWLLVTLSSLNTDIRHSVRPGVKILILKEGWSKRGPVDESADEGEGRFVRPSREF